MKEMGVGDVVDRGRKDKKKKEGESGVGKVKLSQSRLRVSR